jgi:hypothetical protein
MYAGLLVDLAEQWQVLRHNGTTMQPTALLNVTY